MLSEEQKANDLADITDEITAFAQSQLVQFQPRDDYRELPDLTITFLGGVPVKGMSFKAPAGLHRARWMAKVIYSLKILMFKGQIKLTAREEKGFKEICAALR